MGCSGHPCDGCPICVSGACCGEGVVDMTLPVEGSWPGPLFAPLGVLDERDGRVVCHVCGWAGDYLSRHVHEHGLTADQYRAYFGLNIRHALMSRRVLWRYVDAGRRRGAGIPAALAWWNESVTPEQRGLIHWNRERRSEYRLTSVRLDPERQRSFALTRAAQFAGDPEKARAFSIRCRLARRTADDGQTCPECGGTFCHIGPSKSATCLSPECIRASKRRAANKRWEESKSAD